AKNPDQRYQSIDEMLQQVLIFEAAYLQKPLITVSQQKRNISRSFSDPKIATKNKGFFTWLKEESSNRGWSRAAIGFGILGIFLLAIFFISRYGAKSDGAKTVNHPAANLTITTLPVSAKIYLNGDSVGLSPLYDFQVSPGKYNLRLINAEYQTIDTIIFVNAGSSPKLSFSLQIPPSTMADIHYSQAVTKSERQPTSTLANVSINSVPTGAPFWINEKFYGQTPARVSDLPPGSYSLKIQKDGFRAYFSKMVLTEKNNQPILVSLIPYAGMLLIRTLPESVSVHLNGKKIAGDRSPYVQSNLPVGKYMLEAFRKGYSSYRTDLEIKPDETSNISIQLDQLKGKLSIQVKPWGKIYINDQLGKEATDFKYEVELPVDDYQIKVIHPTLGKWEKLISVEAEGQKNIVVDFNREVPVSIWAFDEIGNHVFGEIFLDDHPIGRTTPLEILLRTGLHRLTNTQRIQTE
ncbi:MAG: PEGA domain-containing protein, partial [Bacteroidales bacterium]|nr:PEGA domain-containing protein [Bacteroidales bacterium]